MCRAFVAAVVAAVTLSLSAVGQEYKAESFDGDPPADKLSPDVAKVIASAGCRVSKGTRVFCEIWPVKQLALVEKPATDTIMYPIKPGELVGVMRLPRKTTDFRSQEVSSGVYTIRYGQQPVDGAHVGTFPTRDFLLLLPADQDQSPALIADYKALTKASAASAGTSHPAIFPLLKPPAGDVKVQIRHDEEHDWWLASFAAGKDDGSQGFEMVVVGHAAE